MLDNRHLNIKDIATFTSHIFVMLLKVLIFFSLIVKAKVGVWLK